METYEPNESLMSLLPVASSIFDTTPGSSLFQRKYKKNAATRHSTPNKEVQMTDYSDTVIYPEHLVIY